MFNFTKLFKCKQKNKSQHPLNTTSLKKLIGDSADITIRTINIGGNKQLPATIAYVDGLVDIQIMDQNILKPLQLCQATAEIKDTSDLINKIMDGYVPHISTKLHDTIADCLENILSGSVALVFDSCQKAITFEIKGFEKRAVTDSTSENIIKGGRDCFIEILRTNTSLIRNHIHSDKLRIKEFTVGKKTNTKIAIVYIDGVTSPEIVDKITDRIQSLDINSSLTASIIEDHIVDNKFSIFPQMLNTERPDKFCSNIVEGKLGLIIDGMPTAYILPATFSMFLQAPEDYSFNYIFASFVRILRYCAFLTSLALPAFYIAITSFHQEMIPRKLVLSIISSKEGVPFPSFAEVLFMLLSFEILIEAGLRMPKTVGQAVSIVGAIVIGEAAVAASFISPAVIVIISLAGIAGFTMPNQDFSNAIRVCRIFLVFCSAVAGLFGMVFGFLLLIYSLVKIEVFGVPYFYPYIGIKGSIIKDDSLIRLSGEFKNTD